MPSGRGSRYYQVAEAIAERIYAGDYQPGAHLPSEPDLGHTYDLGIDGIRRSVATLRQWGLVASKHGERSRVVEIHRQTIYEPAGTRVTSEPAGPRELRTLIAGGWDVELVEQGWPVLVVSRPDGSGDPFPSDQVEIVVGDASAE